MRILFCSQIHPTRELGGSKVVIELAEEMARLGWQTNVIGPGDFPSTVGLGEFEAYPSNLRHYLKDHAHQYDVVDYDHVYLPYEREEFNRSTLFVARSVLLPHHLTRIKMPRPKGLKARVRALIKGPRESRKLEAAISNAERSIQAADLVNVSNHDDKAELIKRGVPERKVVVIPFGIDRERRPFFDAISVEPPKTPMIAFVGTFDSRKGATDLPAIVEDIARIVSDVRFRFLGTRRTQEEVRSHFSANLRDRIEVVSSYQTADLPNLLACCSVGVFPSYLEGFGFGVLEMLAASVPVIAYDSPGPPMMLPAEYLVSPGDTKAMSKKVVSLLKGTDQLRRVRSWARRRSLDFRWENIAIVTDRLYAELVVAKRATTRGSFEPVLKTELLLQ